MVALLTVEGQAVIQASGALLKRPDKQVASRQSGKTQQGNTSNFMVPDKRLI